MDTLRLKHRAPHKGVPTAIVKSAIAARRHRKGTRLSKLMRKLWLEAPVLIERSVHVSAEVASEKLVEAGHEAVPSLAWTVLRLLIPLIGLILIAQLARRDLMRAKTNVFYCIVATCDFIDLAVHAIVLLCLLLGNRLDHETEAIGFTAALAGIVSVALSSVVSREAPRAKHH